jgi:hypothetical protein
MLFRQFFINTFFVYIYFYIYHALSLVYSCLLCCY